MHSMIAREEDDFGNVADNRFVQVWNNEHFRAARKYVATGKVHESVANICGRCAMKGTINFDPNVMEAVYYQCAPLRHLLLKMRGLQVSP